MIARWLLVVGATVACGSPGGGGDASAECAAFLGQSAHRDEAGSCVVVVDGETYADCVGQGPPYARLSNSIAHCGRCNRACAGGQRCEAGRCVEIRCARGEALCDAACVRTATDPLHCGACWRRCEVGATCADGRCVCANGRATCRPSAPCATDVLSDPVHCGGCDQRCGVRERCDRGVCAACPAGEVRCGEACVDPRHDPRHCGRCDVACRDGGACREGFCACVSGETVCPEGRGCFSSDGDSCERCGTPCPPDAACRSGRCVADALRLRSPISALHVTSARPWLRWLLPHGADGARVQVCATRACDRVEEEAEVGANRHRPRAPLAAGVHFWRVFVRHGGVTDAVPGPTWEFVVPAGERRRPQGFLDVNGDGLADRVSGALTGSGMDARLTLQVYFGREGGGALTPDQMIPGPAAETTSPHPSPGVTVRSVGAYGNIQAIGDVDGDGYGDLSVVEARTTTVVGMSVAPSTFQRQLFFLGGPSGLQATPREGTSVSTGGVPTSPALIAETVPLGDLDADGFGDLLTFSQWASRQQYVFFHGSPEGPSGGASLPTALHEYQELDVGDFDADGASDLATTMADPWNPLGDPPYPPLRVDPGGGARWSAPFAVCDYVPPHTRGVFPLGVVDANDDGYDDLRIFFGSGSAQYFGSRDGLTSDGCGVGPGQLP